TSIDLAPPRSDRFVREYWVSRSHKSHVRAASLVYFGNFNPVATHIPLLPITDWCTTEQSDQHAAYDPGAHAIVNSWSGTDQASGRPASIAVAFGFAGRDSAHQVGEDAYEPSALQAGPPDPYDQMTRAPHRLGGDGEASGLTRLVTRHNLFYAHAQTSARNPSPIRPAGNWAMAYYFDGVDGAPIPWEIDETGLGIWTLFDHYRYLRGDAARDYLRQVYPAI